MAKIKRSGELLFAATLREEQNMDNPVQAPQGGSAG